MVLELCPYLFLLLYMRYLFFNFLYIILLSFHFTYCKRSKKIESDETLADLQDEAGSEMINLNFEQFTSLVMFPEREERVFAVFIGEKSLCPRC